MSVLAIIINTLTFVIFSLSVTVVLPLVPLSQKWYQLVIMQSGSMMPQVPVGSIAIYKPENDYVSGDIVVYRPEDGFNRSLVVHRIIERHHHADGSLSFLTRGDANQDDTTQAIFKNQIQGKVIAVIPHLGFVANWLQTPQGIGVVFFTLLLGVIVIEGAAK